MAIARRAMAVMDSLVWQDVAVATARSGGRLVIVRRAVMDSLFTTTDPRVYAQCPQSIYKDGRHEWSWTDCNGYSQYCRRCGVWTASVPGYQTVWLRLPKLQPALPPSRRSWIAPWPTR